jgi:hypothetical protein
VFVPYKEQSMRTGHRAFLGIAAVLACSACYHATIETGLPASSNVVTVQWAHSFIYGLIPPATVASASTCKNGVAKVETQHSVLNVLAQIVTFGIYTPMQIDVTCASSNRMASATGSSTEPVIRATGASLEARTAAMAQAVALSESIGHAVYVTF